MGKPKGRILPLSLARQMIGDFVGLSRDMPIANGERRIDIRQLRAAVAAARPRPNWLPIFFKAYAVVAANRPALRRMFVRYPWPRLYEHHENVGSVVISRQVDGDDALLYLPISSPERRSIAEIDTLLKEARLKPLQEVPAFRRQLRLARMPAPIRRSVYRCCMNWAPTQRSRHLGTFGMSCMASMGGATLSTWAPWTTMIHYTPFDGAGSMLLRIALDHRVLDGLETSLALHEMEQVLNTSILDEVSQMPRARAA